MQFQTIVEPARGEFHEKKSLFIGQIFPVSTQEEVKGILQAVAKTYPTANHHCYGFVLGEDGMGLGFGDDGEPSGTAGKPILAVLQGAQLTNVVIVVTRFFGGTLLGTGGLVRAYGEGARQAIAAACIVRKVLGKEMSLQVEYSEYQNLQYYLEQQGIDIIHAVFLEQVTVRIVVALEQVAAVTKAIETLTAGKSAIEILGNSWLTVKG